MVIGLLFIHLLSLVEERERETVIQTKRERKKDTEKKKERECGQK